MQRLISTKLWRELRAYAGKARNRKAAVAYVTQDLIGLRKGDVLVMDASDRAIRYGETSAKLLHKLCQKGVLLYHCVDLHAKVFLLDDVVAISSGNMSNSSADALVEAAVLTDNSATVSGVESFIEQLVQQSDRLTKKRIAALCKIKVIRKSGRNRGRRRKRRTKIAQLGNRTWLVGVRELVRKPPTEEERLIEQATNSLRTRLKRPDEVFDWIKWDRSSRFAHDCREGDSLIQIWRPHQAKRPKNVYKASPVLLKQRAKSWTRFYLREVTGSKKTLSWNRFLRLLNEVGYSRRVGPTVACALDSDMADAIARKWRTVRDERRE
jgi:hypothetical protein